MSGCATIHSVRAAPGSGHSFAPWRCRDDGTIVAADEHIVCVLGCPEEDLTEVDVANGALLLAAPALLVAARRALRTLKALGHSVEPTNALGALDAAIKVAEGRP